MKIYSKRHPDHNLIKDHEEAALKFKEFALAAERASRHLRYLNNDVIPKWIPPAGANRGLIETVRPKKTLPFIDVGEFPGAMERVQAYLKVTAEPRQLSVSWVLDGIVSNMSETK